MSVSVRCRSGEMVDPRRKILSKSVHNWLTYHVFYNNGAAARGGNIFELFWPNLLHTVSTLLSENFVDIHYQWPEISWILKNFGIWGDRAAPGWGKIFQFCRNRLTITIFSFYGKLAEFSQKSDVLCFCAKGKKYLRKLSVFSAEEFSGKNYFEEKLFCCL